MVFHSAGGKPRLNKVKASRGCHRFSEEIYRAELDKIWAQIRQGAFDKLLRKNECISHARHDVNSHIGMKLNSLRQIRFTHKCSLCNIMVL
ncbi:hypothetical protein [Siminovitchia terrae]|uniref:hypothetical protein n=1 Tax=Siminovitchia terrae TaxID=1914933 RepID=UPI001BB43C74|nr:hypothetical protein [Siminovitchia terrae]